MDDRQRQEQRAERERFFGGAKVIAALTLLSRVFGMLRDMAITSLGASREVGAFVLAFRIPNLFRRLFGEGGLSAAFVPVFTETGERAGEPAAGRLLANVLGLLASLLTGLLILLLAALLGWRVLAPGREDHNLLLALTCVMLPFMVTVCLLALASAALNCRGHFAYPAAAPIILNLFLIAAAWLVAPAWRSDRVGQLYVVASAVSIAGAVQLILALVLLRRAGFPLRPRLLPVEPGVRTMLRLMAPMILGLGFLPIASLLEGLVIWVLSATPEAPVLHLGGWQVAKPLPVQTQVHVYAASQLYQFPMGVLAISLGVAAFPLLSRYAARGDLENLRDSFNRAVRLAIMEGLAAGVGLWVLAGPIAHVIFRRREFTAADARTVAQVLQMYVLGMWAYCAYQIFLRTFYALKEPVRPLKVIAAMAVTNLLLVGGLVWIPGLGARAFGLATALTMSAGTLVLAAALRRRLGRIGGRRLAASVSRSAAASGVMAATVLALRAAMGARPAWQVVAACVPAGAGVFALAAWLMRAPELAELLGTLARRTMKD